MVCGFGGNNIFYPVVLVGMGRCDEFLLFDDGLNTLGMLFFDQKNISSTVGGTCIVGRDIVGVGRYGDQMDNGLTLD